MHLRFRPDLYDSSIEFQNFPKKFPLLKVIGFIKSFVINFVENHEEIDEIYEEVGEIQEDLKSKKKLSKMVFCLLAINSQATDRINFGYNYQYKTSIAVNPIRLRPFLLISSIKTTICLYLLSVFLP